MNRALAVVFGTGPPGSRARRDRRVRVPEAATSRFSGVEAMNVGTPGNAPSTVGS